MHGLGELAQRVHEQALVLTSADLLYGGEPFEPGMADTRKRQSSSRARTPRAIGICRRSENGILSLLGVTLSQGQPLSASGERHSFLSGLRQGGGGLGATSCAAPDVELPRRVESDLVQDRNAILPSERAELARDYIEMRDAQSLLDITGQTSMFPAIW
jgi:hypothetical protein